MNPLPYGKQNITEDDINEVIKVLRSDYITQGPKIGEFEEAFAKYLGSKYAVAVANGTAALHLSALALNIRPGDKVITTSLTFAASANCVSYCGGQVVFADINPLTYLIDIDHVRQLLEANPERIKGIIPVDFAGRAVDMEALRILANEYDLWILEDSCHAPGGYFIDSEGNRQYCGNGQFSDLSIFSFHPVKHIATGEGGMITTNNESLYQRLLLLRTHGITKDHSLFENKMDFAAGVEMNHNSGNSIAQYPLWYMEMQELGFNYRLTDFQAALGISQLKRANNGLEKRMQIAQRYSDAFEDCTWIKGQSGRVDGHAYHLYIVEVDDRIGLYNYLRANNIYAQIHYIPVHLMPYYRRYGWVEGDIPNVEKYYKKCISLPMYPTLSIKEQEYVIQSIFEFYK